MSLDQFFKPFSYFSCSFYRYPEVTTDLIAFHNMYMYAMVAFSTGKKLHVLSISIPKKLHSAIQYLIPRSYTTA